MAICRIIYYGACYGPQLEQHFLREFPKILELGFVLIAYNRAGREGSTLTVTIQEAGD